jgi:hypothetical protein
LRDLQQQGSEEHLEASPLYCVKLPPNNNCHQLCYHLDFHPHIRRLMHEKPYCL